MHCDTVRIPGNKIANFLCALSRTVPRKWTKTGRVRHVTAVIQLQKLDFAGGVPPSAELLADLTGFQCQPVVNAVKQGGFSHAGIARKRGDLSLQKGLDRLHPFVVTEETAKNGMPAFS